MSSNLLPWQILIFSSLQNVGCKRLRCLILSFGQYSASLHILEVSASSRAGCTLVFSLGILELCEVHIDRGIVEQLLLLWCHCVIHSRWYAWIIQAYQLHTLARSFIRYGILLLHTCNLIRPYPSSFPDLSYGLAARRFGGSFLQLRLHLEKGWRLSHWWEHPSLLRNNHLERLNLRLGLIWREGILGAIWTQAAIFRALSKTDSPQIFRTGLHAASMLICRGMHLIASGIASRLD